MNKSTFTKLLAQYGAVIDEEMLDADMLQVDAPKGFVFKGNNCHTIVVQYRNNGGQSWLPEARKDLAETLSHGTEPCTAEDCDVCEEG